MSWQADMAPHLVVSARERLKQTPVRVTMGLIIAWVFAVAGHAELVIPWLVVSTLVQLFEHFAMEPFRRRDPAELGRSRHVVPALISIGLFSTTFAVAVIIMWSRSDPTMAAIAIMALAGTLISNIVSGIASRILFMIGATPYLLALCAMPLIGPAQDSPVLWPMVGSVILLVLAVVAIWSRAMSARASEMKALAEAQTRLEQAESAMADRAAMAAIVSHELRTPVSAILAGAHVIRQGDRPEQNVDTADLIMDAGRLMTAMLNDLLDHSKIEARAMTVEARDFDLQGFVQDAARFWNAPAAEKGLTLAVTGPEAPLWLKGDPFRLRQIVNNLMSNAVKFTPTGEIALTVEAEPVSDGRLRLSLTVIDQGPGIPDAAMDRLFTPFAQGSSEVARTYGGTGLGLTVSRELARLMGGDLIAESAQDRGACFRLTVSLPGGEPVEDHAGDVVAPEMRRRMRVLGVDDHEINRRTLSLVFQPLDVELTLASDGATALALLADRTFDVVLMDVNMPGMDGNEATRRLRASSSPNAGVPVIGFSAGTEPAQVAACREAGMTDWLAKPLEPTRLYAALERAMRAERSIEAA